MTLALAPERDLAALRQLVTAWRRAEYETRGGSRIARQLAIYDLSELWGAERSAWHAETAGDSSGAV